MSQLIAMIVRIIDDVNKPEVLSELWHQPLPRVNLEGLEAARYLDGLEEQVAAVGWALMRQLIVEQWRLTDRALVTAYQGEHRDAAVRGDGYDDLQVVSRFGVIQLPRQVCYNAEAGCHVLPGNTALPPRDFPGDHPGVAGMALSVTSRRSVCHRPTAAGVAGPRAGGDLNDTTPALGPASRGPYSPGGTGRGSSAAGT